MAIEINLSKDDIQRFVKDAIMESALGSRIQDAINAALGTNYDNPIDKAVKECVSRIATDLVREKFSEQIKEAVSKTIEEKVTQEVILKVTSAATERIVRAAEERSY